MLELDPDRRLALAYVPAGRRAAVEALWSLDLAFASILTTGREPMISQIRLAWWRESLEMLDHGRPPAEPVLQALGRYVVPHGVSGTVLAGMEDGWAVLNTSDPLGEEQLSRYAHARGALLFRFSAILLGADPTDQVERGGEAWALMDLARHSADPEEAAAARLAASHRTLAGPWPKRVRPLGMLALLAARDARGTGRLEPPGAPARMLRMLRHRLTGR